MSSFITEQMLEKYAVSHETIEQLNEFASLLIKWNSRINLVKFTDMQELWQRHILDSLQLIKYIDINHSVMDLGTGGGFPGIILSILGVKNITFIEADNRKCMFLYQAAKISKNNIIILNQRIEELNASSVDIITSRALSNIDKICSFIARINVNANIILLKGQSVQDEIMLAKKNWIFDYNLYPSQTASGSYIIEIFNLKDKNS